MWGMGIHAFNPNTQKVEVKDCHEFKVSLCHIVNIRLDRATLQNPASKKPKTNQNIKTEKKKILKTPGRG